MRRDDLTVEPRLGRGVVVGAAAEPPHPWQHSPRVVVDAAALEAPVEVADELHRHWVVRRPLVVDLRVDPDVLRQPEPVPAMPVHRLGAGFEFTRERLFFLVWANNYDARSGEPIWWWGRKAQSLGLVPDGPADGLVDGSPVWVDGGPRGPIEGLDHPVWHRESVEIGRRSIWPAVPGDADPGLAPDQEVAASHRAGAARVVAPAGSGKTRVLAARARRLAARGVERDVITAVAYNNRAAAELVSRLGGEAAQVQTIHSLGWETLRRARPGLSIADERECRDLVAELAPVRPRAGEDVHGPYLEALDQVRVMLRDPADVEADRDDVPGLADLFEEYRARLYAAGRVDFAEQVYGAVEALCADSHLRSWLQGRCRHLLVDEFQDLTPAYLLLLRLAASPALQVFGVGDDDQVIYGYAGADPGFLLDFDTLFPGAAHHALTVNYRCPPRVVSAAAHLLSRNRRRVGKELRAAPGRPEAEGGLVVVRKSSQELADAAAETLQAWLANGVAPDGIAVLARVNDALLPIQAALAAAGTPHRPTVPLGYLERTAVKAVLSYLRIGVRPEQIGFRDLSEVVRRPGRGLTRALGTYLPRRRSFAIEDLTGFTARFPDRMHDRWNAFVADLMLVAAMVADDANTRSIIAAVRSTIGLDGAARLLDGSRTAADRSTHRDALDALERAAAHCPQPSEFEPWLRDLLARPGDPDGITLSSVHRVKGMEWPRVVVFAADDGLFPHVLASEFDSREEERRVFHVAMTRGSEEVVVIADRSRPSPFLDELDEPGAPPPEPPPLPPRPVLRRDREEGIVPEPGLELTAPSGHRGPVVEIGARGVAIKLTTGALLTVDYGDRVAASGRTGTLTPPGEEQEPPDASLLEALKEWRRSRATADGVPAYVIAHDAHLEGIASIRPASLEALARCPGIGPARLDRYGEEILAVVSGE